MSGRKLAGALVGIALLTFVLPPFAARQVHLRRVVRAQQEVRRIAAALAGERRRAITAAIAAAGGGPVVLTGPGATPDFAPGLGWPDGRFLPRSTLADSDSGDSWGNSYLIAAGGGPAGPVVVLSAGPNGNVETPFAAAASPRGDDIVAAVAPGK